MTLREIIVLATLFLLYLSLQILIVRNLVLFDYGFCFLYVACILLMPAEINQTALLLLAFLTGVIVDTFYNTLGIHAAATVLMACPASTAALTSSRRSMSERRYSRT